MPKETRDVGRCWCKFPSVSRRFWPANYTCSFRATPQKISLENTAAKVVRLYPHRKKELFFFLRNPKWVIYKLDFLSALDYSSFDLVQVGAGFELNIDVI